MMCAMLALTLAAKVNKMLHWRLSDEAVTEQEKDVDGNVDLEARKKVECQCRGALLASARDVPCRSNARSSLATHPTS